MKKIGARTKYHRMERFVRGFSNHRRIEILELLEKIPELSVAEVSRELKINYKTTSSHMNRLAVAGLILKRNRLNDVRHRLTAKAKAVLKFLRTSEQL
jgi:DNA-binding transcriptional ArsR family regulator